MSNLVERLRTMNISLTHEAADEIERLTELAISEHEELVRVRTLLMSFAK